LRPARARSANSNERCQRDSTDAGGASHDRAYPDELHKLRTTTDSLAILEMFDPPVEPMTLFQRHCRKEEATLYPLMAWSSIPLKSANCSHFFRSFEI
jgi:hypothetical protein